MRFKWWFTEFKGGPKRIVGFYELNPFPGCNQVVVSNHAWLHPDHRGQGVGREGAKNRVFHAQDLGYDYMMCTVREDNKAERNCLSSAGWKELDSFRSKETGHRVVIYGRVL